MRKLFHLLPAFVAGLVLLSACGEVEPPAPNLPSLSIIDEAGNVADGDSVITGSVFTFKVEATQGDDLLNRIEVQENGAALDIARVTLDGFPAGGNPSPLAPEAQTGFTWTIGITAADEADVTNTYSVIVTDETGNTASVDLDIKTFAELESFTGYLLLNQAGPAGTGGLDLDNGNSTGSADTEAEIKDEGIDINLSNAENWIQKISAANDAELRYPDANFDFDALASKAQLQTAWEAGLDVDVSEKVEIGDLFLVKRGDKYYALATTDVVIKPGTPGVGNGDNGDYYEFEVKR
jgi:hypothetical protein